MAEFYSRENLEAQRKELARVEAAWANDTSNNPDKYQSRLTTLRSMVEVIEYGIRVKEENERRSA